MNGKNKKALRWSAGRLKMNQIEEVTQQRLKLRKPQ